MNRSFRGDDARASPAALLANLRDMLATIPHLISDMVEIFALEGRQASMRVIWMIIAGVCSGILLIFGWLCLLGALASVLVRSYGWDWPATLGMIALINVALAIAALWFTHRSSSAGFFAATLARLKSEQAQRTALQQREPAQQPVSSRLRQHERSFDRSLVELKADASFLRRETPRVLVQPRVLLAAAGIGLLLGLLSGRRHRESQITRPSLAGRLSHHFADLAMGHVASLVVPTLLGLLQARGGASKREAAKSR